MVGYPEREGYPPIEIRARYLRGGTVNFHSPPSSQLVSALLMDFEVLQAMVGAVQPTVVLEERVERNVKWLPRPHPVGVSGG